MEPRKPNPAPHMGDLKPVTASSWPQSPPSVKRRGGTHNLHGLPAQTLCDSSLSVVFFFGFPFICLKYLSLKTYTLSSEEFLSLLLSGK